MIVRINKIQAAVNQASQQFTGQVSYDLTSKSTDGLFYGLWAGYGLTESLTLLAEIYGEEALGGDEAVTNWRAGAEVGITEKGTLLLAFGGNISSDDIPSEDELDYDFYVGYRYETKL